jgi:hypothetical protein
VSTIQNRPLISEKALAAHPAKENLSFAELELFRTIALRCASMLMQKLLKKTTLQAQSSRKLLVIPRSLKV